MKLQSTWREKKLIHRGNVMRAIMSRGTIVILSILLEALALDATALAASSGVDVEKLIRKNGGNIYFLAWPSAKFSKVDIENITTTTHGVGATVVLTGKSAFADAEIWVRALIEVRNGKFFDLHWKEHSRTLFPPGFSMSKTMKEELDSINRGHGRLDFRTSPAEAEASRKRWEAFDSLMKMRFKIHRETMGRLRRKNPNVSYLHFKSSSQRCSRLPVAVHYQALHGRWVTMGWKSTHDEDYLSVRNLSSDIWIYARNARVTERPPEELLHLPVVPGRNFIRTGDEDLVGPGVETVPFFKMYRHGRRSSMTAVFSCRSY